MGGIGFRGDANGGGLRFRMPMPVTTEKPVTPARENPIPDIGKLKVLLVEDSALNQWVLERMLKSIGYEVAAVNTATDGLAYWREHRPAVILMDVHLPEMSGIDVTKIIREEESGTPQFTPVVAVSATAQASEVEACEAAGMNAHLVKPFVKEDLQRTIVRVVREMDRARGGAARIEVAEAPGE